MDQKNTTVEVKSKDEPFEIGALSELVIPPSKDTKQNAVQVDDTTHIKSSATFKYCQVNFDKVIAEVDTWDFKIIKTKPESLAQSLSRFVTVGSNIHKLSPDELTIVANHAGKYANKEEKKVHKNGKDTVPDTIKGLMANGTRFFDAFVYVGLEPEQRPKCSPIELIEDESGNQVPPTFDDPTTLTTYIFVIIFYILIRAHPPSDNAAYRGRPTPKFISNILGVKEQMSEIVDYVSSFDLIKLDPSWVKLIPMKNIRQETVNRIGLSVAGYRIVSILNILQPDLYAIEPVPEGKKNIKEKPEYLERAVMVARSFLTAGHCWDFHPATRDPNFITKYGNINKNAINLLIECYTLNTLNILKSIGKLAVLPIFDPSHTEYRLWDETMMYVAKQPIFQK